MLAPFKNIYKLKAIILNYQIIYTILITHLNKNINNFNLLYNQNVGIILLIWLEFYLSVLS